jgi:hypothetical protein
LAPSTPGLTQFFTFDLANAISSTFAHRAVAASVCGIERITVTQKADNATPSDILSTMGMKTSSINLSIGSTRREGDEGARQEKLFVHPAASPTGSAPQTRSISKHANGADGDDNPDRLHPRDDSRPIITLLSNNTLTPIPFDSNFYANAARDIKQ